MRQIIKKNEFLNKLSNIKIGKKTTKQKEVINNLEKFYTSREEVINEIMKMDTIFMNSENSKTSKQHV